MPKVVKSNKVKPELANDLGDFLGKARKAKGLTLMEVAEELGLKSPQPVWDWENGKGSGVPADMLLKLVKIYGISADKAYDQLMKFHQSRTKVKVYEKFEQAKIKVFGKK
jgi:transcriptional regulator with XRE-family HTH domain